MAFVCTVSGLVENTEDAANDTAAVHDDAKNVVVVSAAVVDVTVFVDESVDKKVVSAAAAIVSVVLDEDEI